jgi:hypothetical protein
MDKIYTNVPLLPQRRIGSCTGDFMFISGVLAGILTGMAVTLALQVYHDWKLARFEARVASRHDRINSHG